jgi:hypothetical protein
MYITGYTSRKNDGKGDIGPEFGALELLLPMVVLHSPRRPKDAQSAANVGLR